MKGGATKTGKKSISISISPDFLEDSTKDGKPKENNFRMVDLMLTLTAGLNLGQADKKASDIEKFISNFEMICTSLMQNKKENSGFYWEFYAPYFIEMKDKDLVKTFGYIVHSESGDKSATKWLKSHKTEVDEFYEWSVLYKWIKK